MNRKKQFIWLTKAWYGRSTLKAWAGRDLLDEVALMDGESGSEFAVRWYSLDGNPCPRIEAFCDAWAFLADCPEVTALLKRHDPSGLAPEDFVRGLKDLGWADITPTKPRS